MTETLHGLNLGERTPGVAVPQPEVLPGDQPPANEAAPAPPANQAEELAKEITALKATIALYEAERLAGRVDASTRPQTLFLDPEGLERVKAAAVTRN
jgi:hypothetical protein